MKEEREGLRELVNDKTPLTEKELNELISISQIFGLSEKQIKKIVKESERNPSEVRKSGYKHMLVFIKQEEERAEDEIKQNKIDLEKAKSKSNISPVEIKDKGIFNRFYLSIKKGNKTEHKLRRELNKKLAAEERIKQQRKELSPKERKELLAQKQRLKNELKQVENELIPDSEYSLMHESKEKNLEVMDEIVNRNKETAEKIKETRKLLNSHFPLKGIRRFAKNKEIISANLREFEEKQNELNKTKAKLKKQLSRINEKLN